MEKSNKPLGNKLLITTSVWNSYDLLNLMIYCDPNNFKCLNNDFDNDILSMYDVMMFHIMEEEYVKVLFNKNGFGIFPSSYSYKYKELEVPYEKLDNIFNIEEIAYKESQQDKYFYFLVNYE